MFFCCFWCLFCFVFCFLFFVFMFVYFVCFCLLGFFWGVIKNTVDRCLTPIFPFTYVFHSHGAFHELLVDFQSNY